MSEIVGSISRGKDIKQVRIAFSGKLKPADWQAFILSLDQAAKNYGIKLLEFGSPTVLKPASSARRKATKK